MQEILSFIAQRRSIGQSDQQISSELLSAGWDPQMVSGAFQQSPPASVPHETISPRPQPLDQFYPTQPQQPQQVLQMQQQRPQQIAQPQPMQPQQMQPVRRGLGKLPIIIGVMLVLLILGVIAVVVLGPGSSSGPTSDDPTQRDTERRGDVTRLLAEAETQAALNEGRYPEATREGWELLISNFRDFDDPSTGDAYEFTTATPMSGQMQYANRVLCNEDRLGVGTERSIVIRVLLESGAIYCVDNT